MNLNELTQRLTALADIKPVGDSRTFSYRVPFDDDNTHFFIRPLADDLVLASSVMHASDDASRRFGLDILDVAEPHIPKARSSELTKLPGIKWEFPGFDSLLLLCPEIVHFSVTRDTGFLRACTIGAYAINQIEFSGHETIPEVIARRKHVRVADVTRAIEPVIFLRYHKQTGQRSEKYLAVTDHKYATTLIKQMPRDGGTVELENYERVRLSLATQQGVNQVDATFDEKTTKVSIDDALRLMEALAFRGVDEARKGW